MIHRMQSPLGPIALAANREGALVYLGFQDHEPRTRLLAQLDGAGALARDPYFTPTTG